MYLTLNLRFVLQFIIIFKKNVTIIKKKQKKFIKIIFRLFNTFNVLKYS